MNDHTVQCDRRAFLTRCLGALIAAGAATKSNAADTQRVTPDDPTAQALGYVDDAAKLDPGKFPQHQAAQSCANCRQFTPQAASDHGPCVLFGGKQVSARGWCAAYVARMT